MRKLTVLILVLLYVFSMAAVSAFAANAARDDNSQSVRYPIASRNFPLIDTRPGDSNVPSSKPADDHMALGYLMTGISPGIELGLTSYDLQHNMRMDRQVAAGADGRVHFVWTAAGLPFDAGTRHIQYNWYQASILGESFSLSQALSPEKMPGRFCTVDVFSNRALVVDHYTSAPTRATSALDIGSGAGSFTAVDPPADVVNCEGVYTSGGTALTFQGYIWPDAAADKDGSGKLVVHIIASEGNTAGGSWSAMTYFRGVSAGVTMDPGMYGTCGTFIDSCQSTGYIVGASPYNNDVVIVYPKAREGNRENNDLAYRLSTDMGASWGPIVNVTQYPPLTKARCAGDMSVLFTSDGYFHVLFVEDNYDSVGGTESEQCKLKHWSSQYPTVIPGQPVLSIVLDANNQDPACNTPAFEYNVCKVTLTQCHSTSLAKDLLYAVYSRQLGTATVPDCSDLKYYNQEVFMSPSSTMGETWGAPVNLTNTNTNGCTSGNCADDGSSSSASYVTDSLRIEYMEDLDAGSNVGNESGTASLLNPIKFISTPCIDMAPYLILTCTPSAVKYPFHAKKNQTATQDLLLVNGGNQSISWTASTSGSVPITMTLSGTVTAGYSNSATITATVGPKSTEGLFTGNIHFTYDGGTKSFDVPVDFYCFDSWFLPQDFAIRTAKSKMMVNQASQAADDVAGSSFSFFATGGEDFITDASLIMGNSKDNLSWLLFKGGQGDPTPSNNFGKLYALSNTFPDSTSSPIYRVAYGKGTNRDSTVGFDVKWFAHKHVDSADFYVGHFEVYKGVNNPTGTVSGLDIAFACDWDVPSDTSSDNTIITDPGRQAIILRGEYSATRELGYAASAAYTGDGATLGPITGGFGWGNQQQVYGQSGYIVDSVWKYMQATTNYNSTWQDSIGDMSLVMVIAKNLTVTPTTRFKFDVVLAAKRAEDNAAGLAGINTAIDQGKTFVTRWARCPGCGDANGDGSVDISDVVFLIAHIFSGGAAPKTCVYNKSAGDANADGSVDISDAVYLIARIFSGGAAPHCAGVKK